MYVSKGCIRLKNEKKPKMLALFNTLTEEDKDFVISMADSLVRRYGVFLEVKIKNRKKKEI